MLILARVPVFILLRIPSLSPPLPRDQTSAPPILAISAPSTIKTLFLASAGKRRPMIAGQCPRRLVPGHPATSSTQTLGGLVPPPRFMRSGDSDGYGTSPDFRTWESLQKMPLTSAPKLRCCSILTSPKILHFAHYLTHPGEPRTLQIPHGSAGVAVLGRHGIIIRAAMSKNPLASGISQTDSHVRKSASDSAGDLTRFAVVGSAWMGEVWGGFKSGIRHITRTTAATNDRRWVLSVPDTATHIVTPPLKPTFTPNAHNCVRCALLRISFATLPPFFSHSRRVMYTPLVCLTLHEDGSHTRFIANIRCLPRQFPWSNSGQVNTRNIHYWAVENPRCLRQVDHQRHRKYSSRWNDRGGTVQWPARSPDLTPRIFFGFTSKALSIEKFQQLQRTPCMRMLVMLLAGSTGGISVVIHPEAALVSAYLRAITLTSTVEQCDASPKMFGVQLHVHKYKLKVELVNLALIRTLTFELLHARTSRGGCESTNLDEGFIPMPSAEFTSSSLRQLIKKRDLCSESGEIWEALNIDILRANEGEGR
ncbi:hypothetical protein PR048_031274 [Dryococelus australis]|uniref:Uncharacterized protein n=1 Tax=Dryococelus australis TaxID=614101 RepID=A0ABQ9G4U6_9NEOP|nr:hypothetical protein PR048_031274 [Dryococelus australis]